MKLNADFAARLSEWTDPIGILSIYVGHPVESSKMRPSWPIEIRNGLRDILSHAKQTRPHSEWTAIEARLERLKPQIDHLVDPASPGRGRAMFAAISDEREETLSIQLTWPTRAALNPNPELMSLLYALDEAATCGLICMQRDMVRIHEWELETVEELATHSFEPSGINDWRQMKGPARPNPARGQQSAIHVDRFERRLEDNRQRFLRSVGKEVLDLSVRRGWRRLVLFGDARLGRVLLEALPPQNENLEVVADERVIVDFAQESLHDKARALLKMSHRRREQELVARVQHEDATTGKAVVGLRAALHALNDGRVETLLVDPSVKHAGLRSPEGLLYLAEDQATDQATGPLSAEPRLLESMIRRALTTNAGVVPLESETARPLAAYEGVAATLRW